MFIRENPLPSRLKKFARRIIIILSVITGSILVLVCVLILLLRLPSIQTWVCGKAVSYISGKTHSRIELQRIYIGFPKSVVLEGLYAEDVNHDTLISLQSLELDVDLWKLKDKTIEVDDLEITGLTANVLRTLPDSSFNFDFLIDAFSDSNAVEKPADTSASPWKISVNTIALNNIHASYADSVSGTDLKVVLGKLNLDMESMSLKPLAFRVDELVMADMHGSLRLTKTSVPDTAVAGPLPGLGLKKLRISNSSFLFQNVSGHQEFNFRATELLVMTDELDLNRQILKLKKVQLHRGDIAFAAAGAPDTIKVNKPLQPLMKNIDSEKQVAVSTESGWRVTAGEIAIDETAFRFDILDKPRAKSGIDYSHLALSGIHINIKNALYSTDRIAADILGIALREQSGLHLKEFKAKAVYDNEHAQLASLTLVTGGSRIEHFLEASWPSLETLSNDPGELGIRADFHSCVISPSDVLLFAPTLRNIPVFRKGKAIRVDGKINGQLKNVRIENIRVQAGNSTFVNVNGSIRGLPDAQKAVYELELPMVKTTAADLHSMLPAGSIPPSIELPSAITLRGTFNGSFTSFHSKLFLHSSSGMIGIRADMRNAKGIPAYEAEVITTDFDLGHVLKQPDKLGPVSLTAQISGRGFTKDSMVLTLQTRIRSILANRYTYKNIEVNARADHNVYSGAIHIDDSNLVLKINSEVSLVPEHEKIKVDLNLEGSDLFALHLWKDRVRSSGELSVNLTGKDLENLNGRVSLSNILLIKDGKKYHIDSFLVVAVNDKMHSAFKIKSALLNADYDGSMTLSRLGGAMRHHIDRYFRMPGDSPVVSGDTAEQNFTLEIKVVDIPVLSEVLLTDLQKFIGADLKIDFNSRKEQLNIVARMPSMLYKGQQINGFNLEVHSDKDALKYSVGVKRYHTSIIRLAETTASGSLKHRVLNMNLHVRDKDKGNKLIIGTNITEEKDHSYSIVIDPGNLTFDNTKWNIPVDNVIRISKKGFYAYHVNLTHDQQAMLINSSAKEDNAPLDIEFKAFDLRTFSQIIEKDTAFVRGVLEGKTGFRNLQQKAAFVADLRLGGFSFRDMPVGDISIKADNLQANRYSLHMQLTGNNNDLEVNGSYFASDKHILDFNVDFHRLNISSIEGFTTGNIRRSTGYISGKLSLTGNSDAPKINGALTFNEAAFNIAYINNYVKLQHETMTIDGNGLHFKNFTIRDTTGHPSILNGSVYTSDFTHMKFALEIETRSFTVLQTTANDNQLYYGTVKIDSKIKVTGDESLPIINANMHLLEGSRITVVIPSGDLSTDIGKGVVLFIDSGTVNSIMARKEKKVLAGQNAFKGIELRSNIEISRNTSFKLIVDKTSGDSLVAKGEGVLSFDLDRSGKQTLTGTYTLNDGSYNASFQKVIKRSFKLKSGSAITWNGDPVDATIDITAVYETRTSSLDLLSSELSGVSKQEMQAYRKPLYFQVNMMMKGELMRPEISFSLDMRDKEKNIFGGMVYSKLSSVNNDPAELNKQVFALVVLNKFIATNYTTTSDGGGAGSIARNSVNQALTDQLNQLSGQYIKGVELNFDVQSNDDYSKSTVKENTEVAVGLKKELFNTRLSVQVGSSINVEDNNPQQANASSLTGDVIVEYKLTEDGRYRLKAFRENQYEGIIDGYLYKTGAGIMYIRSYDKMKELFSAPDKSKQDELKTGQ